MFDSDCDIVVSANFRFAIISLRERERERERERVGCFTSVVFFVLCACLSLYFGVPSSSCL